MTPPAIANSPSGKSERKNGSTVLLLVVVDALVFTGLWLVGWMIRHRWGLTAGRPLNPLDSYLQALPILLPVWLLITAYGRHYQIQNRIDSLNQSGAIFRTTVMLWVGTFAAAYLFRGFSLGRSVITLASLGMGIHLMVSRTVLRAHKRRLAAAGEGSVRIAIVGTGDTARLSAAHLATHPDIPYEIAGFVSTEEPDGQEAIDDRPVLGPSRKLESLIREHALDEVVIAEPSLSTDESMSLVDACEKAHVSFRLVTRDFLHVVHNWLKVDEIGDFSVMLIPNDPLPRLGGILKRAMDLLISVPATLMVVPLGALIALAIRLDSPGPVFFIHERIGRGGLRFQIYKFRTMKADTDPYALAPASESDPRVTRVGKWLRRTSLDELPQVWNVIRGEMSLVGPRPEMPFIVEKYAPWQRRRLDVPQGITGLWQIAGRKRLPLHNNMEYDFYYIRNRSLLLDFSILLRTLTAVVFGRGAF